MALTLHLEYAGRSARVALHGLPQDRPRPALHNVTRVGEVTSQRLISGIRRKPPALSFEALVAGDPELDLELAGTDRGGQHQSGLVRSRTPRCRARLVIFPM